MASWLAAAGAFVVSLDSMMNIAFPSIAAAFGVPPESMRGVIIWYTGVYAIMASPEPVTGVVTATPAGSDTWVTAGSTSSGR